MKIKSITKTLNAAKACIHMRGQIPGLELQLANHAALGTDAARAPRRAARCRGSGRGSRAAQPPGAEPVLGRLRCACFLARRWTSAEKTASLWGPDSAKIARAS